MAPKYELLKKRPLWTRWDIVPFLLIYPFILQPFFMRIQESWNPEESDDPSNSTLAFIFDHIDVQRLESHIAQVLIPIFVFIIHIIIISAPNWNMKWRVKMRYLVVPENQATHAVFYPTLHHGKPAIVPIQNGNPRFTMFQKKKRELIDGKFVPIKYPIDKTVLDYLNYRGLTTKQFNKLLDYYGTNSYEMEPPTTWELLKERITSPFFIIMAISIFANMVDQLFIYPLFSVFQILLMEFQSIKARQGNFLELRGADSKPYDVNVRRDNKWITIKSDKLVPGDLILISEACLAPADIVIIHGRAVVNEATLTGESTPQLKDPISNLPKASKITKESRRHIIFSGTSIEQIIPVKHVDGLALPKPGTVCYVESTGLGSSHGKLIRTILYAREGNTSESRDSLYLILFLSVFALYFGGYYFIKAKNASRSNIFRIILQTIILITSTIPSDINIQLSVQINAAILALSRLKVSCMEPFRIPYAGMVSVCCFDKTGTLTAEEYKCVGVDDMKEAPNSSPYADISGTYYSRDSDMPKEAMWVLGGCHSLVRGEYGKLIGDSVEEASFTAMHFKLNPDKSAEHDRVTIRPVKEYYFSSDLRRMTVVCTLEGPDSIPGFIALTKGAPEKIEELLVNVPEGYKEAYSKYTRQGCRVLALAYRTLGSFDKSAERESIEKDLEFVGFAIFNASLKRGTEDTIVSLLQSTHRVIVITGDEPLTACHVARRLHIINKDPAIHDMPAGGATLQDQHGRDLESDEGYAPCYTGRALAAMTKEEFEDAVKRCNVFARMSPQEKSRIIIKLNDLGETTMMCGDGTNDVGALKQAHVGVGLLENAIDDDPASILNSVQDPTKKVGAASIAAPFVSKRPTISCCVDIIRFGRATLSGTLDLYKQTSINALTYAYTQSILYFENVRQGDRQLTIFSSILMLADISMTIAKPRSELSRERPFPGQFNPYLICSVIAQFFTHLLFLHFTHELVFNAGFHVDKFYVNARFTPNLLNTAMFLVSREMQATTALCNYRGYPFMQSFSENPMLLMGIAGSYGFILFLLFGISKWVNRFAQLVEFPSFAFQVKLIAICTLDAVICFAFEKFFLWVFSHKNKNVTQKLVDQEILDEIEDYISNDDDIQPRENYEFGFADMFTQNIANQQKLAMKQNAIKRQKMQQMMEEAKQRSQNQGA